MSELRGNLLPSPPSQIANGLLFYVIDNEIHHRGQGYVYLRALGIESLLFYDRS